MPWTTSNLVGAGLSAVMSTCAADLPEEPISPVIFNFFQNEESYDKENAVWSNFAQISSWHKTESIVDIGSIVNRIKTGLGLPDKDIAEMFQVSRQTIHNYRTQDASTINLKDNTLNRAHLLYEIILDLEKIFTRSPGPRAKNITINQNSLFDLLCQDELHMEKIIETSKVLEEKILQSREASNNHLSDGVEQKRSLYRLTRDT
jgi:hypothetical protein